MPNINDEMEGPVGKMFATELQALWLKLFLFQDFNTCVTLFPNNFEQNFLLGAN